MSRSVSSARSDAEGMQADTQRSNMSITREAAGGASTARSSASSEISFHTYSTAAAQREEEFLESEGEPGKCNTTSRREKPAISSLHHACQRPALRHSTLVSLRRCDAH